MARKIKKGLDYFPLDVDFFEDIKIRKLIKYQGAKAISVYALLLCNIYKNGYYLVWDSELPFIISEKTGCEEAYIHEVKKCALSIGLFSKEMFELNKILTSRGIQERYNEINFNCKRTALVKNYNLINSEEIPITSEEMIITSEEIPITSEFSTQSKVKEIKEKLYKKEDFNFFKELITHGFKESLVTDWLLIRKNKKAMNTKTALSSFLTQVELTKLDKNKVLEIVVEKSWSGFKAQWLENLENLNNAIKGTQTKEQKEYNPYANIPTY